MSQQLTVPIQKQEWYQSLVEDCKDIITEGIFNWRWTLIETYHSVGSRILTETESFKRSKIYGQAIVKNLAESLGRSERTLYYAVQFAREYPDINTLPLGKTISWNKIVTQLLTPPKDLPPQPVIFYNGLATLANLHGPRGQLWTAELPAGTELEGAVAGDEVHAVLKEKP